MLTRRVIVCLDVDGGRVKKGTRFRDLRTHGTPAQMASAYERDGADEIVFLDISATIAGRKTTLGEVRSTAAALTIPLTVGGGVSTVQDIAETLRAGADKVAINTAAVEHPRLITDAAKRFGAQCVVVSIDAQRNGGSWQVATHGGRRITTLDAVEWAERAVALGAGELLVTSIDRDGTAQGYDIELTRAVAERVSVPIVASGGAGEPAHLADALQCGADAVLVAGIVHRGEETVRGLKAYLARAGFVMRDVVQEAVHLA
ncbi:MAG TPA: imidazole glycerol phosphate synthase subunit HisF [Gemmatimonadaceae bacterium]|nr:imidazole glycerol phosphate synthase subunit HisF [Gemmatimonadaceae bacterium]